MISTGGCFCGRVRYRVVAPLGPGRSCHCSRCRKVFSGTGSAYSEVAPGSFSWTSGEDQLAHFETAPGWGLCFCRTCGSTLTCETTMLPTEAHFHVGAFDDPREFEPTRHFFREEQLPWLHLP